jgi:hypothetical protein
MSLQMNNDGDGEKGRVCPILPADDVGVYIKKKKLGCNLKLFLS